MITGRLASREQGRRRLDRRLIAAQPRRNPRRRQQVDVAIGAQDVAGQRQEHRPGRRRQRGLGGAMHEPRQIGQPVHLRRPLHQRARDGRQIRPQDRLGGVEALLVLAGGDEDRRARLLRVVEHAHGVAEAGRDVQVDHGELAGGLRIAVRHRHDGRLLQAEDVAQLVLGRERIHQRQFGGAGIAEHDLDAFLLQQIEEGALSGHDGQRNPPNVGMEKAVYHDAPLRCRMRLRQTSVAEQIAAAPVGGVMRHDAIVKPARFAHQRIDVLRQQETRPTTSAAADRTFAS